MSVAELLGGQPPSDLEARKQKYYTGLHLESPGVSYNDAKPRIDENHRGMQYGDRDYDRGHPHPRPFQDTFGDRPDQEMDRIRRQRQDMDEDIQRMKERQMREKIEREEEKRKTYDLVTKSFPWDQRSHGHGGPRGSGSNRRRKFLETDLSPRHQEGFKDEKRETDLFLDTLGGPGGTVLRQNGSPNLADPRFLQQQQQYQQYQGTTPRGGGMTPREMQEYKEKLDQVSEEKEMMKQQRRIQDLRYQIDQMKTDTGMEPGNDNYTYKSPDYVPNGRQQEHRSLDLDTTQGGAGAPIKGPYGKNVTRMPITLSRDNYGESRIKEDIPGKASFNFDFMEEENKPYYPWGRSGGGAPLRDRDGNVKTQIYGQLERKDGASAEIRRHKRRQEVLYNELKEGVRQQRQNKDELSRYMKAPHVELADVLMAGRVGKPRRNEITGEIEQQHLSNSDVSLLKMNYQPKPLTEKKKYHDELVRMAEERQQQKKLEKLKEKQESNAHFQSLDARWGRPGGGAPKHDVIRKKVNLTNSLFYPDASPEENADMMADHLPLTGLGSFQFQSPLGAYNKLYSEGDGRQFYPPENSPRYVKSTIDSSHKNMFEASPEKRLARPGAEHPLPPYATNGVF